MLWRTILYIQGKEVYMLLMGFIKRKNKMICLTIDVEEWNSPMLRGKYVDENNNTAWSKEGTQKILRLFEKYNIKSTFFITGYFAEREKDFVKEILDKGHEIASHGYSHWYRNNPNLDLINDIKKSKHILEKITKKTIIGFRSPQLQYTEQLIKVLDQLKFKYDSSLHPAFLPGFYNNSNEPMAPFKALKTLMEFPLGVMPIIRSPIGWMFFRNLGVRWTQTGINLLTRKKINPVIYFHPWECIKLNSKYVPFYFKTNTGDKFLRTIEKLIIRNKARNFTSLGSLLKNSDWGLDNDIPSVKKEIKSNKITTSFALKRP